MRANRRFAVLALAAGCALAGPLAAPITALGQALPPPPYAADQSQPDGYGASSATPQGLDRYGGGYRRPVRSTPPPAKSGAFPGAAPALAGPTLSWGGKVEAPAQPVGPAQGGGWSSMSGRWSATAQAPVQPQTQTQTQTQAQFQVQTPAQAVAQMAPPNNPWRPYQPAAAPAQPAPSSIYDAPPAGQPPAAQPYQQAQAAQSAPGGPHFYSLHREYGIQPDPIPLPPQFFGPTADLSAPVTDPLAKRTTTVNGQTKTVNAPDDQSGQ